MRKWMMAAVVAVGLAAVGCDKSDDYSGPKVSGVNGKLVANGKPVQFGANETVELQLFTQKGDQIRVPVKADGSFQLDSIPAGKYSAKLSRVKSTSESAKKGSNAPSFHNVANGFDVKEGQSEYTIELGKNFKL